MDDKTEIDIQDLRANNDNDLLSSGIDHQKKDFHSKKFHAVSFHGFYLANTDFSQAVFQNVTFTPYSLTKADLTDAKFDPIEGTEIFSTFDLQKLLAAKSLRGISIPVRTWDNNFKHLGEVEKKEKENQFKSKIMQDYKDFFSNEKNKKTLFTIYKKILYAQTKKKPSYDENLPENRILSIDDWEEILNVAREKHSEFTQVDINNINEQEKLLFKEPKKEKGSETTNGSDPDLDDFEEVKNDENDKKEFDEPNIKLARPPFLTYNALVHRLVEENGLTLVAIVGGVGNILESARVFEDAQKNYHIFYYPGIDNDQPKNKSSFPLKKIVQLADSCIQNSFDNPLNQAKIAAAKKYYLIASDKKNHFTAIVPHGKNSHQLINSQPAVFNTNPDANYLNECGIQLEKTLHTNTQWDNWACPHYSVEAILLAYKDNEKADYSKINVTDDVAKKNIGYDAKYKRGDKPAGIPFLAPENLTIATAVKSLTSPDLANLIQELNTPEQTDHKINYFNFNGNVENNAEQKREKPIKSTLIFSSTEDLQQTKDTLYQTQLYYGVNTRKKPYQKINAIKRLEINNGAIGYRVAFTNKNLEEKLSLLLASAHAHQEGLSLAIPDDVNTYEFLLALNNLLQKDSYQNIPTVFIKLSDQQRRDLTLKWGFEDFQSFFKHSKIPVILNTGYLNAPAVAAKNKNIAMRIAEVFNPKDKNSSLNYQQLQQNFSPENNAEWFSPHNYCSVDTLGNGILPQNPVSKFNSETKKYQYYFLVMALKKYFSETTGINYRLKPANVKLSKHRIKLCNLVMDFIAQEKTLDELKQFMKDLGDAAQSKTKIRDSRFKKIMGQLIVDSQQINEKLDKNSILFQKIDREIEWAKPENRDQKILADKISAIWVKTWFPMPTEYQCPDISNISQIVFNNNPADLNSLTAICQNTYSWIERFSFGARLEGMRELRNCVETKLFGIESDDSKQSLILNLNNLKFLLKNMSDQKILKNNYLEQMRSALDKQIINIQTTDTELTDIFIDCRKIAENSLSSWLHNQSSTFGHYFDQNRGRSKEVHELYKAFKNTCLINTSPNVVENFNFQTLTIAIQNLAQSVKITLPSVSQNDNDFDSAEFESEIGSGLDC